jgi:hypothetical protein
VVAERDAENAGAGERCPRTPEIALSDALLGKITAETG